MSRRNIASTFVSLLCVFSFSAALFSGCGGGDGGTAAVTPSGLNVTASSSSISGTTGSTFTLSCAVSGGIMSTLEGRCDTTNAWSTISTGSTMACTYSTAGSYTPGCRVNGTVDDNTDSAITVTSGCSASTWAKTYTSGGINGIDQTSDCGFVVGGVKTGTPTTDAWMGILDQSGTSQSEKTFSSYSRAYAVDQTADGGYILAGSTDGGTYFVLKMDSSQATQWEQVFNNGINGIRQTSDGGYILGGVIAGTPTYDAWVAKLDSTGTKQWEKTYSTYNRAYDVDQTSDGGYVIAGSTDSDTAFVLKIDSSQTTQWEQIFNSVTINGIRQTSDGGYILGGVIAGTPTYDAWVAQLDTAGTKQWEKTYSSYNRAYAIGQTSDGGYIVAGLTDSNDSFVMKTDQAGVCTGCN